MQRFLYSFAYLFLLALPASVLVVVVWDVIDLRALLTTTAITLFVGGVFDIWAVRQSKRDRFFIWEYNSRSILGWKIYGVPIEDYIFFLVLTPFFIVTVYETVRTYFVTWSEQSTIILIATVVLIASYSAVYHYAIKKKRWF